MLFIEDFMARTSPRQALFEAFSQNAVETVLSSNSESPPLIMLTGGLRTRAQFTRVIQEKHAHLLGLARMAVLQPNLPRLLHEKESLKSESDETTFEWELRPSPEPHSSFWSIPLLGAGIGMAWYTVAMRRFSERRQLPLGRWWPFIIVEMFFGRYAIPSTAVALVIASISMLTFAISLCKLHVASTIGDQQL